MLRLAYFVSHPIQYQAPLLRMIAADEEIDLKVFFYSDFSLKPYKDEGFGKVIKWDVSLTEGYNYRFLDCWYNNPQLNASQKSFAKDIYRQLKQGNYDAVWVHGWSWICSIQAILAANQLNIPVLIRGESNCLGGSANSLKQIVKKKILSLLFKRISAFLAIGTLNRQFYKGYGVKDKLIFDMPYAVDNEFFRQQAIKAQGKREEMRESLNLEPGRPIILYAAKLIEVKRPQDLLAAYQLLSPDGKQEPDPYLLIVGDGALRSVLEEQAKQTQWQSIRFLGFRNQSEMPFIYDLCDVFVLPSSFEPWGLAINEVMNAGKAVIVSDRVGCAIDLVIEEKNGKIFPVGNKLALAEALRWGIANRDSAGDYSLRQVQKWSYREDIQGLKQALNYLQEKN